jgi:hypothetical protein
MVSKLVAGVPERNDRHAPEIAKVALDLLAKVLMHFGWFVSLWVSLNVNLWLSGKMEKMRT